MYNENRLKSDAALGIYMSQTWGREPELAASSSLVCNQIFFWVRLRRKYLFIFI